MDETSRVTLTPAQRSRTDVLGPSSNVTADLPRALSGPAVHSNTQGFTFRAGEPPPAWLKWYVGQGGVTGTRSGTPFATHDPNETRSPGDPPPVDWDPEAKTRT